MGILLNVLGWVSLLMGLSMYKLRKAVAEEAHVEVKKVEMTTYTLVTISIILLLLGGKFV